MDAPFEVRFTDRGESWGKKLISSNSAAWLIALRCDLLDHRESILHTKDKIYIGVDNTTVLEGNAGRPAVRIESKKSSLEREVETGVWGADWL